MGAAWIISKENFLSKAEWIDMLKLKASIGQQGNDNIGDYYYTDLYSLSKVDDKSMSASFAIQGNPNITWETTTNANVGVEFSFWRGRLSGRCGRLSQEDDRPALLALAPRIGRHARHVRQPGRYPQRGCRDQPDGFDHPHQDGGLERIGQPLAQLDEDPFAARHEAHAGYLEHRIPGVAEQCQRCGTAKAARLYNAYLPSYAGVDDKGQAMYYIDTKDEADNTIHKGGTTYDINSATKYEQGSILPKVFGGFGTNLRVGNFDLSLTFDYQIGGKVYDVTLRLADVALVGSRLRQRHPQGLGAKSWSPNNTDSDIPRWQQGDQYTTAKSDRFLTDASYLNFQSFAIGYTIPERVFHNKLKMRIYAAGENLCFWSGAQGSRPALQLRRNLDDGCGRLFADPHDLRRYPAYVLITKKHSKHEQAYQINSHPAHRSVGTLHGCLQETFPSRERLP